MILESLIVPLTLDTKNFTEGIEKAEKSTGNLVNGLSKVGGGLLAGGIGLASAGIAGLTGLVYESTQGAMEAEKIQAQLNSVLESTGGISGMTADSVNDLATSLSEVTMFEDDTIVATENMLLTFTNLGSEVFPSVTEMALDMSQALGQDTKSSAMQLGKALNDPINGVTALTRVGVTFTEAQKEQIKVLQESGDIVGAQNVILGELQKEFGGSAKAAGATAQGGLTILMNKLGNIKDMIGSAVIPVIVQLASQFSAWLSNPATQAGITNLVNGIALLATNVISYLPTVIQTFVDIGNWFASNPGVIVAGLAMIGVAIGAYIYTSLMAAIPALVAFMVASWPVIAVIAAVGAAAYLLYQAWTTNFGGIRTFITDLWESKLKPVFDALVTWLKTNIPVAIQALSNFWTNTLLPAIKNVWSWMNSTLFPFLQSVGEFLSAVFGVAVTALAGLWENVLLPALKTAYDYLKANVFPILKDIGEWITSHVSPAFDGLSNALSNATQWFRDMAGAIRNIQLPSWLTPGSPFPLTTAMWGLNDSLRQVARESIPELSAGLNISGVISPNAQNIQASSNDEQNQYLRELAEKETGFDYYKMATTFRDVLVNMSA